MTDDILDSRIQLSQRSSGSTIASNSGPGLPIMDSAYLRYLTSDIMQRHLLSYPDAPKPPPTQQPHVYYDPYNAGVSLSETYTYSDPVSRECAMDSHSTTSTNAAQISASPDTASHSDVRRDPRPLWSILKSQAGSHAVSHGRVLKSQTGGKVALRNQRRSQKSSSRRSDHDDDHLGPCWRCRKYKKPVC